MVLHPEREESLSWTWKGIRTTHQLIVLDVATLILGDVETASERDIILEKRPGKLKRISEFHTAYLTYQYPWYLHIERMDIYSLFKEKYKKENQEEQGYNKGLDFF